jgi:hypothetical protein
MTTTQATKDVTNKAEAGGGGGEEREEAMSLLLPSPPLESVPDDEEEEDDAFPKVDSNTPSTKVPKLETSRKLNCSIPHKTATLALVNGSAALMVSTKAALLP